MYQIFQFPDPRDFEHTSQVLVFNQSITSHRVHVNIFEDEVVEDTEIFFVVLAAPLNETGAAIVQNTSAIHIIDDDGKTGFPYSMEQPILNVLLQY